jgi:hypothetical protein
MLENLCFLSLFMLVVGTCLRDGRKYFHLLPLKLFIIDILLYSLYIYMYIQRGLEPTYMCACMYLLVVCVCYTYIIIIIIRTYFRQFLFGLILKDLNLIFLAFFHVIVHTTQLYIKPYVISSVFLSRPSVNAAEVTN